MAPTRATGSKAVTPMQEPREKVTRTSAGRLENFMSEMLMTIWFGFERSVIPRPPAL